MIPPECFPPARELLKRIPSCDFHVHTLYSDGKPTIREYIKMAREINLQHLAFSDHIRKGSTWLPRFLEDFHQAQRENPDLHLYKAAEAKLTDTNELDLDPEVLPQLDLVIGVVHRYPDVKNGGYILPTELTREQAFQRDFQSTLRLIELNDVQVIGHLGGVYFKYHGSYPLEAYRELIQQIKRKNKILEVNPRYIGNLQEFLDLCVEINPQVSLGSDAHSLSELGGARRAVEEALWKL